MSKERKNRFQKVFFQAKTFSNFQVLNLNQKIKAATEKINFGNLNELESQRIDRTFEMLEQQTFHWQKSKN